MKLPVQNLSPSGSPLRFTSRLPLTALLVGLMFLGTLAGSMAVAADDPGTDQYNLATGLYQKERWDMAAEQYQKFLKDYPQHVKVPFAQLNLGKSLVHLQKHEDARAILRIYVQNYPNSKKLSEAMYYVGECSYLTGDYKSAAKELGDYLQKFPDDPLTEWALPYLGDTQLRSNQPKEATQSFQASLKKYPNGAMADDAKFGLARAYETLDQGPQAEEIYRELSAKTQSRRAPSAQFRLAGRLFAASKFAESGAAYDDVIKRFPESTLVATADLNAGFAYFQAGDFTTAMARFDRASTTPEQNVTALYWKGMSQKSLQKYTDAAATLKAIYELKPDDPKAESILYHWADSELRGGQAEPAQLHFLEVVKRWPKGELADDSLHHAAETALTRGQLDESQQLLDRFAAEYPMSGLRLYQELLRGRLLRDRGGDEQLKQALVHFKKVQDESTIPQTQMTARYYIADTYQRLGDTATVLATLEPLIADVKAKGAKSEFVEVLVIQAASLLQEKKYAECIEASSEYLKHLPEGPQAEKVISYKAIANTYLGDAAAAQHNLTILFNKYPQSPNLAKTTHQMAEITYEAQKWDVSAKLFATLEKFGSESPYHAQALSGTAWCLYQQQQFEPSAAQFGEVVKQHPQDKLAAEAGFMQGKSFEAANQLDKAHAAYQTTMTTYAPAREAYLAGLQGARVLGRQGEIEKADAAYGELLKLFPQPEQLDKLLDEWALLNYEAERFEKADEIFRRLIADVPTSELVDNARMSLAESDLVAGKLEEARKAFQELEAANTSDAHVQEVSLYRLINVAIELEDWADAQKRSEQLEQRFPQGTFVWYGRFQRAEALFRQDKTDEAFTALNAIKAEKQNEAVSKADWFPRVFVLLAEIHLKRKEYDQLQAIVDELIAFDPKSPFLYQANEVLGRGFKNQAKFKEATEIFAKVIDDPNGRATETAAKSQFMIAEILLLQKNHKAAQLEYLKVDIHYDFPQWQAPALYQTGQCHEALNEVPLAQKTYVDLVKRFPDSEYAAKATERLNALKK